MAKNSSRKKQITEIAYFSLGRDMLKNSVEVDDMDEKESMLKVAEKVKELQAVAKKK